MNTRKSLAASAIVVAAVLSSSLARADEPAADPLSSPPAPAAPPIVYVPTSTTTVTSAEPTANPESDQTLFRGRIHQGGYGGPETKMTTLTHEAAFLVGGQAGWVVGKHFVLGGAGYGLVSNHSPVAQLQRETGSSRIDLGYGGPRIAWIFAPTQVVHFSLGTLIGAGGVGISTKDAAKESGYNRHDSEAFFVMEPQFEAELNVVRYMRVAFEGSFRYVSDTGKPGLHTSDLSGPAAGIALKFGYF